MFKKLGLALPTGFPECVQQSQAVFFLSFLFKPVTFSLKTFLFLLAKFNKKKNKGGRREEVILLLVLKREMNL